MKSIALPRSDTYVVSKAPPSTTPPVARPSKPPGRASNSNTSPSPKSTPQHRSSSIQKPSRLPVRTQTINNSSTNAKKETNVSPVKRPLRSSSVAAQSPTPIASSTMKTIRKRPSNPCKAIQVDLKVKSVSSERGKPIQDDGYSTWSSSDVKDAMNQSTKPVDDGQCLLFVSALISSSSSFSANESFTTFASRNILESISE